MSNEVPDDPRHAILFPNLPDGAPQERLLALLQDISRLEIATNRLVQQVEEQYTDVWIPALFCPAALLRMWQPVEQQEREEPPQPIHIDCRQMVPGAPLPLQLRRIGPTAPNQPQFMQLVPPPAVRQGPPPAVRPDPPPTPISPTNPDWMASIVLNPALPPTPPMFANNRRFQIYWHMIHGCQ